MSTSIALLAGSGCAHPISDSETAETSDGASGGGGEGIGTWTSQGPSHTGAGGTESGTVASSSTGSGACDAGEHFCGGVCTGNTPGTGCAQSASCEPCAAPGHALPTCTDAGECAFTCADGYDEVGGGCECASACCSDADCGGGDVCSSGTCQPPPCYWQDCFVSCVLGLHCGGICVGTTCACLPCQ